MEYVQDKVKRAISYLNGTDLSPISTEQPVDLEALRLRLAKMTTAELRKFGEAARFMCSPGANPGHPPREPFVIQLNEAYAEWRRRHSRPASA